MSLVLAGVGIALVVSSSPTFEPDPGERISGYAMEEYVGGDAYNYIIESNMINGRILAQASRAHHRSILGIALILCSILVCLFGIRVPSTFQTSTLLSADADNIGDGSESADDTRLADKVEN